MPPPTEFYNSYHFVPLNSTAEGRSNAADFREGRSAIEYGHEKFHKDRRCGRIVCTMTTKAPIFIGAGRKKGLEVTRPGIDKKKDYTIIEPFKFGGEIAIPPSSIRGMLSSVVEAVSASAMRVLDEGKPVSFRKPMRGGAITALGVLVKDGDGLKLRPLSLPCMKRSGQNICFADKAGLWAKAYEKYANMRVYIDSYSRGGGNKARNNFSENGKSDQFFWLHCAAGGTLNDWMQNNNGARGRLKSKGPLYVAQDMNALETKNGQPKLDNGNPDTSYTRGVVRTFGGQGRDLPGQKKHNLFMPYPDDKNLRNDLLPINPKAIETFNALAAERGYIKNRKEKQPEPRTSLPYLPFLEDRGQEKKDWVKPDGKDYWVPRLRAGHIVYFNIEADKNGNPQVSEISFSEIWRGAVKKGDQSPASLHDFFSEVDKELLPYTENRQWITPAERLFGFVDATNEERDGKRVDDLINRAFKGRVRPSLGLSLKTVELLENQGDNLNGTRGDDAEGAREALDGHTRLKILDAPKPPSPALYFKYQDENKNTPERPNAIAKNALSLASHTPQGRKAYLHQNKDGEPWRTRAPYAEDKRTEQKSAIKPIGAGNTFWFHLDFDDLTQEEINLLCFALHPSQDFQHKIGMGKPIGLGSIKIDIKGLFLIDRKRRYQSADIFAASRYRTVEKGGKPEEKWPAQYVREHTALSGFLETPDCVLNRARKYEQSCLGKTCAAAIAALKTIGEMTELEHTVTYPLTEIQMVALRNNLARAEEDMFKWFANRDRGQGNTETNQMKPITDGKISPLKTN